MTSALNSITNSFNIYFETHTPKDEAILKPVERARSARYADYIAVPGLNFVVGPVRIITSVAIRIIAHIAMKVTKEGKAFDYWKHIRERAGDEFNRGFLEFCFLGFFELIDTFVRKGDIEGFIPSYNVASGKYVYVKDDNPNSNLLYSNIQYIGKADKVFEYRRGLQFDENAIEAVRTNSIKFDDKK
jgi:hypothetical protein